MAIKRISLFVLFTVCAVAVRGIGAQPKDPCGLLQPADFQTLASKQKVKPSKMGTGSTGDLNCMYDWGSGAGRYIVTTMIGETARVWPGMSPAMIKIAMSAQASPQNPNTTLVPDTGDVSIYQVESAKEEQTTTVVKGHLLVVTIQGADTHKFKDALIALTKLAVSRLQQ